MANEWRDLPPGLNDAARGLIGGLRAAKDACEVSLADLAAHTHYSRASWERWLNGKRLVTPTALYAFARMTGIDGAALGKLLETASLEGGSAAAARQPSPDPAGAATARLPPEIADFTGREPQIETIISALTTSAAGQTSVAVVCGGGGVGKTALAVHVAHRAAARYPDGALYVDLRGVDENPRDPADVLAAWLTALGEAPERIPASLDDRVGRFRSLASDKALLVVLDNARDAAQIRPLLPATGRGAVIVTSRAQLAHLPAAARVQLEPMTYSESLSLLENVAGAERIGREPEAAAAVLDACAGLPLALRICAARLETRPSWSVRTLAERISDEHRRLDELAVGDLATRSSFDMSYAQLSDEAEDGAISPARAFRLLGAASLVDIGLLPAAALFGVDVDRAEYALETLVDAHLLESPSPERYRFHDLISLYAAERGTTEAAQERLAATRRLASWYMYAYESALTHLATTPRTPAPESVVLRTPEIDLADYPQALSWMDREAVNLVPIARITERYEHHDIAAHLPNTLYAYLDLRGMWDDFQGVNTVGLRAAVALGNENLEAVTLNGIGWVHYRRYETEAALASMGRALEIFERIGLPHAQAATLEMMSTVHSSTGNLETALELQRRSVEKTREHGDAHRLLVSSTNLALEYARMGRIAEFFELSEPALASARALSNVHVQAHLLEAAGELHLLEGRVQQAVDALLESIELFRHTGNQPALADALEALGNAYAVAERDEQALQSWNEAVALFDACDLQRAKDLRERIPGSSSAARR
jgi:tetratricopeptide (TPR) repeat protein/transcriptional regulator with XRE-family HTH domain